MGRSRQGVQVVEIPTATSSLEEIIPQASKGSAMKHHVHNNVTWLESWMTYMTVLVNAHLSSDDRQRKQGIPHICVNNVRSPFLDAGGFREQILGHR